ncbi:MULTISPECIES: restriction endonuclease subunit S [Aeromonas]|uniref:restriction endonuclease subunit S n=1 Tax=Aeromonas TaxID=642 RepID=UPI001013A274|nr:restriction endonuclease subunit S [Aeromonas veronii]
MSQWKMVEIGKCCTSISKVKADYFSSVDEFIYIDISAIDRETKAICSIEPMLADDAPSRAKQIIKKDDVLISTVRPNLNAVAKVNAFADGAIASTGFCVLRSNPEVINSTYLYYFVRSNSFIDYLNSLATGASYPAVSDKIVKACKIPLPPLDIQKQNVTRLELAQALIDQRKQQLGMMDTLIQSTFYEMFGDPVKNEKRWEIKPLSLLSKKITDGTHQSPNWADNGHPFIFVSNIRNHEIDFNTSKFVSQEEAIRLHKGCKIEIGDVLLTVVGSYGYSARVKDSNVFAFQRHIAHIKPLPGLIDSVFLERLLSSLEIKGYIDNVVTGIAQKTLTLSELKKLPTIVPPLPLQQRFATRVQQIETLKSQMTASLAELEQNFNALMQQSFAG